MVTRREFCGIALGAGAALALKPGLLPATQQSGEPGAALIQRAIPSTGEMLPVIGLQFGNPPPPDHAALKEVLKTLIEHGGRLLDTVHGNGEAEEVTASIASELGVQDKVFWSARGSPPGPPQPGAAAAKAQIERSLSRFKVPKIDLVMLNPAAADPAHLEVLKEEKKAGRIRYIGAKVISDQQYPKLEAAMRNEPIDFIGVDYAIDNRGVEQTILPLAQERKIAVLAYFPFGTGSLFQRAGKTPLPNWAGEFDAESWAQFFLKYVISHPAVTVARVGTSKPQHMLDNLAGGTGRLPDEAMRKRMAELVDAWPQAQRPGGRRP
jgi:aryl-alcohol dehydrogenase-like predicted oxidoreductase